MSMTGFSPVQQAMASGRQRLQSNANAPSPQGGGTSASGGGTSPGGRPAFNQHQGQFSLNFGGPSGGLDAVSQALSNLQSGPSQQQTDLINQITQQRFQQGAQGLQQQAKQLSALLSGSAAARGLGKSSVGLGQQSQLGQSMLQQLGNLQGGLQTAGAQQLFQVPFQNTQLALQGLGIGMGRLNNAEGIRSGERMQRQAQRSQGSGLGSLLGGAAGSFLGPLGTAAGSALGGLFSGGGGGSSPIVAPTSAPGYGTHNYNMPM